MCPVREAHRVGKGVVPGALFLDGLGLGKPGGQGVDQRPFRGSDVTAQCKRG